MPPLRTAALGIALSIAFAVPMAAADCAICDREVVLNRTLAECFLARYNELATQRRSVIAVDLADCAPAAGETERGVVEALSPPGMAGLRPDKRFMISRTQLSCLRDRLTEEDVVLDPAVRIELDDCP